MPHQYAKLPLRERFESHVSQEPGDGCWLWRGVQAGADGYGIFRFGWRAFGAHRFAYELYVGQIPAGMFVCHRCDNRACVRPDHLFLGTPADNMADMHGKGRARPPVGERNWNTHLTASVVLEIRRRLALGEFQRSLAKEFGVTQSAVSKIASGRRWKHVA